MPKCLRCGEEFTPPDDKTNVCAACGDELRAEAEQDASIAQAEADTEAKARWMESETFKDERGL